jgi:Right handed beta helix region
MIKHCGARLRALVLGLTLGSTVAPAGAAGLNVVVDDNLSCPRASFTNLQDAINFVGDNPGTITVCPGVYRGQFQIVNAHNLKLIGKKGAVIGPSFATSPLFTGVLLTVDRSTNITVQGLTFDGAGVLQNFGDPNAIEYFDSSGTIRKNTIVNWHRVAFHPPDLVNGRPAGLLHSIHAIGFSVTRAPVKIASNTITEYQEKGIDVEGSLVVTITGNKLTAGLPPGDPATTFSQAINLQPTGITGAASPIGLVQGNTITGHGGSSGNNAIDSGILAKQVGSLKVMGNTLSHVVTGITFFANCVSPADANNNTVQANTITEAIDGIDVTAIGGFPNACDPHVDNYVITGNTIVNNVHDPLDFGLSGIAFDIRGSGTGHAFALNETVMGNTIIFYNVGVDTLPQSDGTITGIFEPNKIQLAQSM